MKMSRSNVVPFSKQELTILEELRKRTSDYLYVFLET